jgi:molecular chaperone DnaK
MPIIRSALESEIGAKLDSSHDPMTVVARGAALYASTCERTKVQAGSAPAAAAASGEVAVTLSYERASGTLQSPVAGVLPEASAVHEIKIDQESGLWTSGWIAVTGGVFETQVMLDSHRPTTRFLLSARDRSGNAVAVTPKDFSISYMLPIASPPLPHTIAIELATNSGISTFDVVFKRQSPLPAEVRKTYRSERALRPSEVNTTLPIKFWETEVSDDPQEKWWAGAVHIRADRIRRPIPQGSDMELTVKIDQSRKMTVEVFIPLLNQSFVEGVYIPDPPSARSQIRQQFDLCFDRIEHIGRLIYELDREDVRERAGFVRSSLEKLFEEANSRGGVEVSDPDAEMEAGEGLKRIRLQLTQLEEQLESAEIQSAEMREIRGQAKFTEQVVFNCGNPAQQAEMAKLTEQMNRYLEAEDHRGLAWVRTQMIELRAMILDHQPWYWQNVLAFLKRPERRFANRAEAEIWLRRAEEAERAQQLPQLRDALCKVWEMQPPDQVELSKQQAAQSGLRPV